MTLLCTRE